MRQAIQEELIVDEALGQTGGLVASGGAWVLATGEEPVRALGPALLWSGRAEASSLDLIVDDAAEAGSVGDLARRAGAFDDHVRVWRLVGTDLEAAQPSAITPPPMLTSQEWALAGLISDAGARPVDDHGRLVAEVAGLEVARVALDDDGSARLDVGVGQADRELHVLVHTNVDSDTALRRAISAVLEHRNPSARPHPLNRMARERWLRSALLDTPDAVGAGELEPVPPLRPRDTVLGNVPTAAAGRRTDGAPLVVVCSVGIDPDLVPEAADYRHRTDAEAELVIAVPHRDRHRLTESLVDQLPNARLVGLTPPWES